jgi:hypothetical protein
MRVRDLPYAQATPEVPFATGGHGSVFPGMLIEVDEDKLRRAESRVELLFSDLDI